jgi:hypothetical protein
MRGATGEIVAGKVVLEGEPFEEGVILAVIAADDSESFESLRNRKPSFSKRALKSIADEFVDGAEFYTASKAAPQQPFYTGRRRLLG